MHNALFEICKYYVSSMSKIAINKRLIIRLLVVRAASPRSAILCATTDSNCLVIPRKRRVFAVQTSPRAKL